MARFLTFFIDNDADLSEDDLQSLNHAMSAYRGHCGDEMTRAVRGTVLERWLPLVNDALEADRTELPHLRTVEKLQERLRASLQQCLQSTRPSVEQLLEIGRLATAFAEKINQEVAEVVKAHDLLIQHDSLCRASESLTKWSASRKRTLEETLEPGEILEGPENKRPRSPAEEAAVAALAGMRNHRSAHVQPVY